MTLENCRSMLEQAKLKGNTDEVAMLEARIVRKLNHPKYAHLNIPKLEVKEDGKKSKR